MGIWFLLLYLVGVGSLFFILMCVNPHGTGILARMNRFCYDTLPEWGTSITTKICGPRCAPALTYYCSYIFKKRNPFFQVSSRQILYLLLSVGGFFIYCMFGFVHLPNPYLSYSHVHYGTVVFAICLYSFMKTSFTSPGVVTKATEPKLKDVFPMDNLLYTPKDCSTCKIPK